MSLFKLASKGIRLIKGGAKPRKSYGTIKKNPNSFKGVESVGVTSRASKPAARGMKTYKSLSTAGKVRSNARMFNPMGKNADQRYVGRFGIALGSGVGLGNLSERKRNKKKK